MVIKNKHQNYQVLETRLKIKNNGDYDTALSNRKLQELKKMVTN